MIPTLISQTIKEAIHPSGKAYSITNTDILRNTPAPHHAALMLYEKDTTQRISPSPIYCSPPIILADGTVVSKEHIAHNTFSDYSTARHYFPLSSQAQRMLEKEKEHYTASEEEQQAFFQAFDKPHEHEALLKQTGFIKQ